MKKLFFIFIFLPFWGNAQEIIPCECADALLAIKKYEKVSRSEEALKEAHRLFVESGYNGDIIKFKKLISTNFEALLDAHKLFASEGYNGDINQFKNLIGIDQKISQNSIELQPVYLTNKDSLINYLYSWAKSEGYDKSPEVFVNFIQNDEKAFTYVFNHFKKSGNKQNKFEFAALLGVNGKEKNDRIKNNYENYLIKCKSTIDEMPEDEKKKFNEVAINCPSYKEYELLLDKMPDSKSTQDKITDSYYLNGMIKFIGGYYKEAILDFNNSIEHEPENLKDSYAYRGASKAGLNDYMGAISDYNKSIELGKGDTIVFTFRAVSKSALGDYRGAISDCTRAIDMKYNYAFAFNTRAKAKYELKDYKGALLDFTKVIELDPKDFGAYYNRGLTKYALNDKDGACLDFSKAGELGMAEAYEIIREHCN
jgi:tetratricopeptide (TPR) repeat protein